MKRSEKRPWIWAHRGASAHAPENTHLAFARAIEDGADGVELDVRQAACGTVVVAHDPTLERVASRPELVAALSTSQLAEVDLGATRGVPTLDAAIEQVVGAGLLLNVELKGDVPSRAALTRAVAALLATRRADEREAIVCSSFHPEMLLGLRLLGARVPLAFLFDATHTGPRRAALVVRSLRPEGVHPHHLLASRRAIARWHEAGMFVSAWTVDDDSRISSLKDDGVDGIITNDPRRARAVLGG